MSSARYTSSGPPRGYRRPDQYYYDDVPSYRPGRAVGVSDEGDDDDDDASGSEDEETAVATDLSLAHPSSRPAAANHRAGFRSNPISDQVEFDKEAAPATVPRLPPKPKPKPRFIEPTRETAPPRRAAPKQEEAPRRQQPQARFARPAPISDDDDDEDSDDSTVIDDAPPARRGIPPPQRAHSAAVPVRPNPAPVARARIEHPLAALQYPRAAHGYSSFAGHEEEPDEDDEDAFTAVGTGVATDLSFEDEPLPALPRASAATVAARPGLSGRAASGALLPPSHPSALRHAPPSPRPAAPLPAPSSAEAELLSLLGAMNFSLALKDLHDALGLGVQRTLVSDDGRGRGYVVVHCATLPRPSALDDPSNSHLQQHWAPLMGSRWEFRTESHSVTVVWKSTAVGAYESRALAARAGAGPGPTRR